jgi:glycosyltransferase involved in cell wall biosynthesis
MRHVAICNWRDMRHPEGGGSELYVETVASGLAAVGHQVTVLCAAVAGQPGDEVRDGVRYRRRGGRRTVYLRAALALVRRSVRADVVIDVQNGVPFLSSLVTRRPVVALVHHVHREQWPILFGRRAARVGWWIESRMAPWLYRKSRYIAVSDATRAELVTLGVAPDRISVVHNGSPVAQRALRPRSVTPQVIVLGRLVPHKRVEVVLRAAAALRAQHPDLHVDVVGHGYWDPELRAEVSRLHLDDAVSFHGFVDEETKVDLLASAWVNAVPSVKEGWGLSVVEAGRQQTPTLAFASAGGLAESVISDVSGVLVEDSQEAFTAALGELLTDRHRREAMGRAADAHAGAFTWETAVRSVAGVLDSAVARTRAHAA